MQRSRECVTPFHARLTCPKLTSHELIVNRILTAYEHIFLQAWIHSFLHIEATYFEGLVAQYHREGSFEVFDGKRFPLIILDCEEVRLPTPSDAQLYSPRTLATTVGGTNRIRREAVESCAKRLGTFASWKVTRHLWPMPCFLERRFQW